MDHLGTRRCMLAIATHSTAVKLHAYSQAGFEAAAVDFDAEHLAHELRGMLAPAEQMIGWFCLGLHATQNKRLGENRRIRSLLTI